MNKVNLYKLFISISTCILLILSTLYFYKVIHINSDAFMEEIGVSAIYKHGFSVWRNIYLPFAPDFFPDYLIYYLVYPFFYNIIDKLYVTSALGVFFIIASAFSVLYVAEVKDRWLSVIIVSLMTLIYVYLAALYPGMWFWYYSANDNLGALIGGLFALSIWLSYCKKPAIYTWCLLAVWSIFNIINCRLYVVTFLAPAFVYSLFCAYNERRYQKKYTFWFKESLSLILIYLVAVYLVEAYLFPFAEVKAKIGGGHGHQFVAFAAFCKSIYQLLSYSTTLLWLAIGVWLISLQMIMWEFKQRKAFYLNFSNCYSKKFIFFWFVVIAIPINLIAPIATGVLVNLASFRYYASLLALPQILSLLIVLNNFRFYKTSAFINLLSGFLSIALLSILINYKNLANSIYVARKINFPLSLCLDKNRSKYGLKDGLSTYWDAYPVNVFSSQSFLLPIGDNLTPVTVLNRADISKNADGRSRLYNYVVVNDKFNDGFDAKKLLAVLPKPKQQFICAKNYHVLVYDYVQAKLITQSVIELTNLSNFMVGKSDYLALDSSSPTIESGFLKNNLVNKKYNLSYVSFINRNRWLPGKYRIEITKSPKFTCYIAIGELSKDSDHKNTNLITFKRQQIAFSQVITITHKQKWNNIGVWVYAKNPDHLKHLQFSIMRLS